ncbi:GIY-YIG nuclease family protein [Paucibacter sp. TC2R-5]|uniref:GIY-YIG nuclease family protein n=1 Tax=Paucibacter sp. TC2R-5 TaxID=2893555 RepID=UPI0021E3C98C|nr:GIY-YIG nuclease family protein [Paucibacter sp. TC2R-5]MCV2359679.1 GIY-YIG nuclease family protein [Paucibacter sp. TC2R-5]
MALGKSIRIYLADGGVTGLRHGEIVNWTGQAIACPRTRFQELREWTEAKRPGIYFLFGQDDESGQDSVYIGEAEVVFDRLCSHISGKDFWTELVAFTSKDDNLTKAHVRYLESRLVSVATHAGRYAIENSASPQLPSLPRADRDAMEEFIGGIQTLLGVLGHRVLEPLVERAGIALTHEVVPGTQAAIQPIFEPSANFALLPSQTQTFQLRVSNLIATAVRTDEGLVVLANSEAASAVQNSLSVGYRTLREQLISSGVLIGSGSKLKFSRDQLFRSPSQAAAVVVGYSINGRDNWKTPNGVSFTDFENRLARNTYSVSSA